MPNCERCGIYCKTAKYLIKHQQSAKYCAKYQDIIFVCKRCNFNCNGIKTIENHSDECTGENIVSNPLAEMVNAKQLVEDEKRLIVIKVNQLETKLKNKELAVMNLQLRLQFEEMKNKIYTNIIQTQTNINLENIIQENEKDVHIFNFKDGNIPIVVHEFAEQNTTKYVLKIPKPKPKLKIKRIIIDETKVPELVIEDDDIIVKKKTYRTVKKYIKISEKELDNKLKKDVVRVDKEIEQIVYDNFDVSRREVNESIEVLFNTVVNSRIYTASLASMCRLRKKLLGKITLNEYTDLVNSHITRLEEIFTSKNCITKKINKIIASSLTPLEMRLSYYTGYTNVNIEIDEFQKFGLALEILIEHKKQFIPYNKQLFFNNIKNYGLSLFELRECVERCLVNRYGFQNVIYIPRLTSKDRYSFYTLASVGEIRCWKMDCRLEDFSADFADIALTYCISLFRKIYKDVFNDNIYRSDYLCKSQITEFDCEQLIINIILTSQPMALCRMFQEIITIKCTITPTESDKFDLYGDDKFMQKRFISQKDNDEDICQIIKRIFDGISDEDAMNVIISR